MDNFEWPEPDVLPDDIRTICHFNGVTWIHDYQDACVDKLERLLLRGVRVPDFSGRVGYRVIPDIFEKKVQVRFFRVKFPWLHELIAIFVKL